MTQEQLEQLLLHAVSAKRQEEKKDGRLTSYLVQEYIAAMMQRGNVNKKQNDKEEK